MFTDCLAGRVTPIPCAGTGQSAALLVSQPSPTSGGWVFELSVRTLDNALYVVRRKTLTNALRAQSRVFLTATVPGATGWVATAYPPDGAQGVRASLVASDTPFMNYDDTELGQPGSKGWSYAVTAVVNVPVGARVKEVSAVAGGAGGTCQITVPRDAVSTDALPAIPIGANERFFLPQTTLEGLVGPATVTFAGTDRQFVAWLE